MEVLISETMFVSVVIILSLQFWKRCGLLFSLTLFQVATTVIQKMTTRGGSKTDEESNFKLEKMQSEKPTLCNAG